MQYLFILPLRYASLREWFATIYEIFQLIDLCVTIVDYSRKILNLNLDNLSWLSLKWQLASTAFKPMTPAMSLQYLYQLSYEATQWGAGQFVALIYANFSCWLYTLDNTWRRRGLSFLYSCYLLPYRRGILLGMKKLVDIYSFVNHSTTPVTSVRQRFFFH